MQVSDKTLKDMVSHIQDPEVKRRYENVIGGVVVREVVCLSKTCKGAVIGQYYADGQLVEVNNSARSGCLSSRQRLDGHMGYLCRCGNDSRLSEAEQGVITAATPTKNDLSIIYERTQKKPTEFKSTAAGYQVDGFRVREVK